MKDIIKIQMRSLTIPLLLLMLCIVSPNIAYAESAMPIAKKTECSTAITTRAEIINWRYKVVDGVLYRRLYNYSKGEWIGDWEEI